MPIILIFEYIPFTLCMILSEGVRDCLRWSDFVLGGQRFSDVVTDCPWWSEIFEVVLDCPRRSDYLRRSEIFWGSKRSFEIIPYCQILSEADWDCRRFSKLVCDCPRWTKIFPCVRDYLSWSEIVRGGQRFSYVVWDCLRKSLIVQGG